ncbi:MAG: membrane dipeptidase [Gemmatales bacterium]|nr:membrane dipeptidase [Gemmatales bacterium]
MLIFDAHLDVAWNALDWNRDYEQPLAVIRAAESEMPGKGRGRNTVCFPEMRRGQVGISIMTLLPKLLRDTMPPLQPYRSAVSAYAAARGQLAYYETIIERGVLAWVRNQRELERAVASWENGADTNPPLFFILSMEGADAILHPRQVEEWWHRGLRIVGPAHYGVNAYTPGTGCEGGLFPAGRDLLREMERVGMILDVTHLTDQAFDEALEIYHGPVLASHHNCRALVPHQRQLTDEQIRRLIARGAVIGAACDAWMLYPGWVRGETSPEVVSLEAVADQIDHVCQLAGNSRHSALGSDLDGGFGTEQTPRDLQSIADLQKLIPILERRGYTQDDIRNIFYRNWVRFFQTAWKDN